MCWYLGLPAIRRGVCMRGWGPRTCDSDGQYENSCRIWQLRQHRVKLCHSACGSLSQMSEFDPDGASLGWWFFGYNRAVGHYPSGLLGSLPGSKRVLKATLAPRHFRPAPCQKRCCGAQESHSSPSSFSGKRSYRAGWEG